ncbi:hypothetical protein ACTHQY_16240 [Rhodococcoides corynebacterioides]|uniref:hypothetical protein n=1 Tax=Rhodococcoides corynebacterioides TaxID=53972 RepID=UPI003F7DC25A
MTTVTERSESAAEDAEDADAEDTDAAVDSGVENEVATDGRNDADGPALRVGARVRAVSSDTSADTDTTAVLGTVVDDYAGTLTGDTGGRTWAVPHRWAVALDDGRLVFRDDDDLEVVDGA